MNIELFVQYFLATAILFDASIAWFVLLKTPKRAVNQAYFFMVFWITLWQVGNFATSYLTLGSDLWYLFTVRWVYGAAVMMVAAALYFIFVLSSDAHQRRLLYGLGGVAGVAAVVALSPLVISHVQHLGNVVEPAFGPLYFSYVSLLFVLAVALLTMLVYQWSQTADSRVQVQLQYLTLGLAIPVLFGGFVNLYLPYLAFSSGLSSYVVSALQNLGPASTVFISGFTAYSILRYRLMDMKVVVQRSSLSAVASLFTLAVVLLVLVGVEKIFDVPLRRSELLVAAVVFAVVLFFFPPIKRGMRWIVGRMVKRGTIDFRQWTAEEQSLLARAENPKKFARLLVAEFLHEMPVESLTVLVYDHLAQSMPVVYPEPVRKVHALDEPWIVALFRDPRVLSVGQVARRKWSESERASMGKVFEKFGVEYVIPLKQYKRLLGIVLVGERLDGQPFSVEDRKFFADFQSQFAYLIWHSLQMHHAARTSLDAFCEQHDQSNRV